MLDIPQNHQVKKQKELRKLNKNKGSPGWVARLVRASSRYAKVVGSIPCQGTYKNQPMNA